MRAVIQRVLDAAVTVEGKSVAEIGQGIVTFLGVAKGDSEEQARKLVQKICELRIFEDEQGKMNKSLGDVGGSHLIVSQFTLLGDCGSGRRPSFVNAERPELARAIYEKALEWSRCSGIPTFGGVFQADMKVRLTNDGPVTFILEA